MEAVIPIHFKFAKNKSSQTVDNSLSGKTEFRDRELKIREDLEQSKSTITSWRTGITKKIPKHIAAKYQPKGEKWILKELV